MMKFLLIVSLLSCRTIDSRLSTDAQQSAFVDRFAKLLSAAVLHKGKNFYRYGEDGLEVDESHPDSAQFYSTATQLSADLATLSREGLVEMVRHKTSIRDRVLLLRSETGLWASSDLMNFMTSLLDEEFVLALIDESEVLRVLESHVDDDDEAIDIMVTLMTDRPLMVQNAARRMTKTARIFWSENHERLADRILDREIYDDAVAIRLRAVMREETEYLLGFRGLPTSSGFEFDRREDGFSNGLSLYCVTSDIFETTTENKTGKDRRRRKGMQLIYTDSLYLDAADQVKIQCGPRRFSISVVELKPLKIKSSETYDLKYPLKATLVTTPLPNQIQVVTAAAMQLLYLSTHGFQPKSVSYLRQPLGELKQSMVHSQIVMSRFTFGAQSSYSDPGTLFDSGSSVIRIKAEKMTVKGMLSLDVFIPLKGEMRGQNFTLDSLTQVFCGKVEQNQHQHTFIFSTGSADYRSDVFTGVFLSFVRHQRVFPDVLPIPTAVAIEPREPAFKDSALQGLFDLDFQLTQIAHLEEVNNMRDLKARVDAAMKVGSPHRVLGFLRDYYRASMPRIPEESDGGVDVRTSELSCSSERENSSDVFLHPKIYVVRDEFLNREFRL